MPICAPWITVRWWDKRNRIICHSTKGGRVYNRLHVYRDPALNMHDAIIPTKLFAVKPENAKRAQKTVSGLPNLLSGTFLTGGPGSEWRRFHAESYTSIEEAVIIYMRDIILAVLATS